MQSVLQYVLYLGLLVVLAIPLGSYMQKVRTERDLSVPRF